jgi:hypothetical protein
LVLPELTVIGAMPPARASLASVAKRGGAGDLADQSAHHLNHSVELAKAPGSVRVRPSSGRGRRAVPYHATEVAVGHNHDVIALGGGAPGEHSRALSVQLCRLHPAVMGMVSPIS